MTSITQSAPGRGAAWAVLIGMGVTSVTFNPQLPQFPIVVELARLGGWKISAEAIQAAQVQASQAGTLLAGVPVPFLNTSQSRSHASKTGSHPYLSSPHPTSASHDVSLSRHP